MKPALEALLKKERNLWRGRDQYYTRDILPTGHARLDTILPGGGWALGALTELIPDCEGIGEFSLLLPALRQITGNGQWAALINPPYIPYAPAMANAGLDLEHMLIVDTGNDADTLWSAEQLLRSGTFQAVIVWLTKANAGQLRRLQLAAESGGTWAVAYRHANAVSQHSPAALRIRLSPASSKDSSGLKLQLIKVRGGAIHNLVIQGSEFDALQGVEWPGHEEYFCTHNPSGAP